MKSDSTPSHHDTSLNTTNSSLDKSGRGGGVGVQQILDLHGLTKERATETLTSFLEQIRNNKQHQAECWITIVTGTGSHSTHGPVLRPAICKTLTKRQMKFMLNPGKGSISCDALSGIDLYADDTLKQDTKVVVVPNDTKDDVKLVNRNNHSARASSSSSSTDDGTDEQTSPISNEDMPLPCEVAQEDAILERVKRESSSEMVELKQKVQTEEKDVEEALARSLKEEEEKQSGNGQSDDDSSASDSQYKKDLERALGISEQEEGDQSTHHLKNDDEIEEEIRKATEESLKTLKTQKMEEEMMKRCLEESIKTQDIHEDELQRALELSQTEKSWISPEEEDMVRKIIERSQKETAAYTSPDEDIMQTVIKRSQKETTSDVGCEEEEEIIREAIRMSLLEASNSLPDNT